MKNLWNGLCITLSMYSIVPMPHVPWKRENMRYALCFLPLVGALIGLCEWLWFIFCFGAEAAPLFYAVGAALLPVLISGGIHLDGLADTCDAMGSHAEPDKRLEIMKDPHLGAFGLLGMVAFLLGEVALFAQIYDKPYVLFPVWVGFAAARMAGACAVVSIPCAKNTGLAFIFAGNSDRKAAERILRMEQICFAVIALLLQLQVYMVLLLVLYFAWSYVNQKLCMTRFGGITGDLAGFLISTNELLFLAAAALGGLLL